MALLEAALEYRDATNGAFDITIAPVMDAWGFTGDSFRVPEQAELDALLRRVNSGEIQMQAESTESVALGERGRPSTSAASPRAIPLIWWSRPSGPTALKVGKFLWAGNVFVLGGKPDGSDWRVGIKDPQNEEALAVILLCGTPMPSPPAAMSDTLRKTEKPTTTLLTPPPAIRRTTVCCR